MVLVRRHWEHSNREVFGGAGLHDWILEVLYRMLFLNDSMENISSNCSQTPN